MGRIPVFQKSGVSKDTAMPLKWDPAAPLSAETDPTSPSLDVVGSLQRKIEELERKNQELKRLNDELYKASVAKILDKV